MSEETQTNQPIESLVDTSGMSPEPKAFMEAAVFVAAAAQLVGPFNGVAASLLASQAKTMFAQVGNLPVVAQVAARKPPCQMKSIQKLNH
jgi:hypothetical protein